MGGADKDKNFVWKYGKTVNIFMFRVIFFVHRMRLKQMYIKIPEFLETDFIEYKIYILRIFSFTVYVNAHFEKSWNTFETDFSVCKIYVSRIFFVPRIRLTQIYKKIPNFLETDYSVCKFMFRVIFSFPVYV